MKKVLYLLVTLAVLLAIYFLFEWVANLKDHGSVLIGISGWSIETSVVAFLATLLICFLVFYVAFRMLGVVIKMPRKLKMRRKNVKFNRSQEALIAGLVDSAEGNWEKAEKTLIKHVTHSGAPLIHYLTAARAAQSRGALAKRDEYLRQAASQSPGSEIAIGLTQAELHISEHQFEQAVEILTRLRALNPTHSGVLKLLHFSYKKVGDWDGLRQLVPVLNEQKILLESEIKALEIEIFSEKLKAAGVSKDTSALQALWISVPDYLKKMPDVAAVYFASMIQAGESNVIEPELVMALSDRWNAKLLGLYCSLQEQDIDHQILIAERWLPAHPNDTQLLNLLGRLNLQLGDLQQAEQYLRKSIAQKPGVKTLQLLGETLSKAGEQEQAALFFKQGLALAVTELDAYETSFLSE